jgi:hypothetical protein
MQRKTVVTKVSAKEIQNVKNPKARAVLREIAQIDKNPKIATPREFALAAERMQRKLLDVKAKQWVGVVDGLTKSKHVKAEKLLPEVSQEEWAKMTKPLGVENEGDEDFKKIMPAEWVEIFKKNGLDEKFPKKDQDKLFIELTPEEEKKLIENFKAGNKVNEDEDDISDEDLENLSLSELRVKLEKAEKKLDAYENQDLKNLEMELDEIAKQLNADDEEFTPLKVPQAGKSVKAKEDEITTPPDVIGSRRRIRVNGKWQGGTAQD